METTDVTEVATEATNENATQENNEQDNNTEQEAEGKSAATVKIDKGNLFLTLESISDGQWKGFTFYVPEFKTLEGAIAHFTEKSANAKDGSDTILGIVNSALANRMRSRANSKLVVPSKIDGKPTTVVSKAAFIEERKSWLNDPAKRILVSEEDALNYVPGEREVDSISGLIRQKDSILKAIKEKKELISKAESEDTKASLKTDALALLEKYKETMALIEAKQAAEQQELLDSI